MVALPPARLGRRAGAALGLGLWITKANKGAGWLD